jgi:hypothetical protein
MGPDEIDIIVYHAHCLDGIMAAVAAYQYNRSYEFIPMNAGEIPAELYEKTGNILFMDVSPQKNRIPKIEGEM